MIIGETFLGIDLTEDNNNIVPEGKEFLAQELSEATADALRSSTEIAAEFEEKGDVSKGW